MTGITSGMSIIFIGIRLNTGGSIRLWIGRIQVFMGICDEGSSRRIGRVNLMRIWRLESDSIDAVRRLTGILRAADFKGTE